MCLVLSIYLWIETHICGNFYLFTNHFPHLIPIITHYLFNLSTLPLLVLVNCVSVVGLGVNTGVNINVFECKSVIMPFAVCGAADRAQCHGAGVSVQSGPTVAVQRPAQANERPPRDNGEQCVFVCLKRET